MSRRNPALEPGIRGRLHRLTEGESPRKVKVSKSLRFFHEILRLEHLQYGLWNGEPLTLDGLKAAQERYAETLHGWIPEGVKTVLDVGAGTGAGAARLTELGYEVDGLSPDPYQKALFTSKVERPFHQARLQEFTPPHSYDLVLMSESAQYVWLEIFFPSIRKVAAPGGHLLLSDYFVAAEDGGTQSKSGHLLDRFLEAAEKEGFELLRREDVTDRTTPTLDLARGFFERYALPTGRLAAELFGTDHPWLYRLGKRLLKKQLRKLDEATELVDSEQFKRVKRYLFLLFRVPAS